MRRIILTGCLITITAVSGCNRSEKVTEPVPTVQLSGKLLAYWCAIDDPNGTYDRRYSVETGLAASIDLIDSRNRTRTIETDDTSGFSVRLDTGSYNIVVRTAYAFPDSFGPTRIGRDTLVPFKINYDYLWVDTIYVSFVYAGTTDTANYILEARRFAFLDQSLPGILNLSPMTRLTFVDVPRDSCAAQYQIRVKAPYAVWEGIDGINRIVRQHPDSFLCRVSVHPELYGCVP